MDNYIGEIRLFPYNRIPTADGWMPCNGQTLTIQQNQALYALINIMYGGDGKTTFMLPNLNGRAIMGMGKSPVSGTIYQIAQKGGQETVALTPEQLPTHNHVVLVANSYETSLPGTNFIGNPNIPTSSSQQKKNLGAAFFYNNLGPTTSLHPSSVTTTGSGNAHENRMPFVAMVYCIATVGYFPPRQ